VSPSITSDFAHKHVLRALVSFALRGRRIITGMWDESETLCISFDCDTDGDMKEIPSLLGLLGDKSVRSTFGLVGTLAERYPDVVKDILRNGHEILNHTFFHPQTFCSIGDNAMRNEVEHFQKLMIERFHYRPQGFRAPHLMRKYDRTLFRILKCNQLYDTSYVGRGIAIIDGVIELPLTSCPDHPQLCFDYWHHFQLPIIKSSWRKFVILWKDLLAEKSFLNIYLDPHLVSGKFLQEMITAVPDNFKFVKLNDVAAVASGIPNSERRLQKDSGF